MRLESAIYSDRGGGHGRQSGLIVCCFAWNSFPFVNGLGCPLHRTRLQFGLVHSAPSRQCGNQRRSGWWIYIVAEWETTFFLVSCSFTTTKTMTHNGILCFSIAFGFRHQGLQSRSKLPFRFGKPWGNPGLWRSQRSRWMCHSTLPSAANVTKPTESNSTATTMKKIKAQHFLLPAVLPVVLFLVLPFGCVNLKRTELLWFFVFYNSFRSPPWKCCSYFSGFTTSQQQLESSLKVFASESNTLVVWGRSERTWKVMSTTKTLKKSVSPCSFFVI